jgi:hypothetical protein
MRNPPCPGEVRRRLSGGAELSGAAPAWSTVHLATGVRPATTCEDRHTTHLRNTWSAAARTPHRLSVETPPGQTIRWCLLRADRFAIFQATARAVRASASWAGAGLLTFERLPGKFETAPVGKVTTHRRRVKGCNNEERPQNGAKGTLALGTCRREAPPSQLPRDEGLDPTEGIVRLILVRSAAAPRTPPTGRGWPAGPGLPYRSAQEWGRQVTED